MFIVKNFGVLFITWDDVDGEGSEQILTKLYENNSAFIHGMTYASLPIEAKDEIINLILKRLIPKNNKKEIG